MGRPTLLSYRRGPQNNAQDSFSVYRHEAYTRPIGLCSVCDGDITCDIKNLDLAPKGQCLMRRDLLDCGVFAVLTRGKELSKESGSKKKNPPYKRSVTKDYRLARERTRVSGEVNNVVIARAQFLEELDSLGTRHVPAKMAEFFHEIQRKDCEIVDKLQILAREMELNARKKNLFIEKLNGLIPY
ncbi:hypothetical protein Tco_1104805 [Tanacetum coccineum]